MDNIDASASGAAAKLSRTPEQGRGGRRQQRRWHWVWDSTLKRSMCSVGGIHLIQYSLY